MRRVLVQRTLVQRVLAQRVLRFLLIVLQWNALSCAYGQVPAKVPMKAPEATAALARLAASGWTRSLTLAAGAVTRPADAIITGTITRHFSDGPSSTPFTIKIRGTEQYRYAEDGSSVVMVANGLAGAVVGSDGKARRLPPHSALSSPGMVLPMMSVVSDWNASDVEVTSLGTTVIGGESCIGVQLKRQYTDTDPMARIRRVIAPTVVWISNASGMVLRADYYRAAPDNANAAMRETVLYSDYRIVDGIAVPFRQDILLEEHRIQTFQFSAVQFNAGLADADFSVAAMTGGAR